MSERKRQKTKHTLSHQIIGTKFEDLPNELILIIFDYFDFYHLYESFYSLNQRFNQLIKNHAKIYLNLDSFPERKLLTFYYKLNKFIRKTENYPLSIQTYNKTRLNLILHDDLFKNQFSQLKSLTVASMKVDVLNNILFDKNIKLYRRLERLHLTCEISGEDYEIERFSNQLLSSKMKSLKYLNLNFEPYSCGCEQSLYIRKDYVDLEIHLSKEEQKFSSLETLIIGYIPDEDIDDDCRGTRISFNTLTKDLLPFLPKLKTLIVNPVYFDDDDSYVRKKKVSSKKQTIENISTNLKSIKIWIYTRKNRKTNLTEKENIIRGFFLPNNSSQSTTIKLFHINNTNVLV